MDEMNLQPQAFKEAPMVALSSVSVSISLARAAGTLRISREFNARLGTEFWALSDDRGLICVALSEAEAHQRMAA
jgi:hypothetical protein